MDDLFLKNSEVFKTLLRISALCAMTGAIIYGGLILWPQLAVSGPGFILGKAASKEHLTYLYSVGVGFTRPNSVAVDEKGRVFITDAGTKKVHAFDPRGRKLFEISGTGAKDGEFGFPNGVLAVADGNILVSDSIKNNVQLFSSKGKYLKTVLTMGEQGRPGSMFKDRDGLIYVSDLLNNKVLVMRENGTLLYSVESENKPLSYPQSVARDQKGRIWVADAGSYSIRIFEPGKAERGMNLKALEVSAVKGGGNPETSFSMVRGVVFDNSGRAFVSDTLSGKVRIFDVQGQQIGLFPSSPKKEKELKFPTNMVMDSEGKKLYVVDRGANEVRVFSVSTDMVRS